jgi:hypothetical protein
MGAWGGESGSSRVPRMGEGQKQCDRHGRSHALFDGVVLRGHKLLDESGIGVDAALKNLHIRPDNSLLVRVGWTSGIHRRYPTTRGAWPAFLRRSR